MTVGSRVLVTGGAGYIGSHAVLALLNANMQVVVLDNLSTGRRAAVPQDAIFIESDLAETASLTGPAGVTTHLLTLPITRLEALEDSPPQGRSMR